MTKKEKKNVGYCVAGCFVLIYVMPSIMNPTVPRTNANIVGRVWTADPYLSEAAVIKKKEC